jgi:hypothetical protein
MDRFYASWKNGKKRKAKKLERLKSFVHFCMKRNGWPRISLRICKLRDA